MRSDVADVTLRATKGVASQGRVPIRFLLARERAVLLIHGFNVTENEAVRTLSGFREALAYFADALLSQTFLCTWSGNWNIPIVRPAAYPFMLGNARESARTLLELLQEWYTAPTAPEELVIVAHSLGCRLTVDMLADLAKNRPQRLKRLIVILMAPAVPVGHVDAGGKLQAAAQAPNVTVVLYSQADSILGAVFSLGQTLARDGILPEAVGLRGNPHPGPWTRTQAMRAFDHGDYWDELETAELVCQIIGAPIRASAVGSSFPLATRKLLAQRRLPLAPLLLGY